jgi:hypothetical protein
MILDRKKATYPMLGAVVIIIFVLLFAFVSLMHGSVAGPRNSLGVAIYEDNPLTYKAGTVVDGAIVGNHEALSIRIQPTGTYALFTESILFCGTPGHMFDSKSSPLVLVYETQAHRRVDGVACHNLVIVGELK